MEVVDPNLGSEFDEKQAERMIKVALLCTNASPKLRPTMSAVIRMLEGEDKIPEEVSDPSIYGKDMRFSPFRDRFQHMDMQSSNGSLAPNFSSDGAQGGSSSASAQDLYQINVDSNQFGQTTSLVFHKRSDLPIQ